ncbi:5-oxoprolinase subunit C family protein [Emticicia agri]|uniref:Biotin-dependent carboxyltransferase family protein n=1 Tax=Emticicia agri TaxID=2492393 RepID=A0A4V1ZCQ5_9BACT|nr:biotin-dependent carboxyltransferase family protein [Emticicia agri]RYU93480.1 biotin-dependent carboxyltransferase family protein [Emticicia agri]
MRFIKSGILSTYQDSGRNGYRYLGINPNVAMDRMAVRLLNILLQNEEDEAAIEIHFPCPEIVMEKDSIIAIGGADFAPYLIDENRQIQEINNWQCTWVPAGSTLKFKKRIYGQRAYIAIKGGFSAKEWLGSKSTNHLLDFNTINPGHEVETRAFPRPDFLPYLGISLVPPYSDSPVIRLIRGNEYEFLTTESKNILENHTFTISQQSNRMGFRLAGEALHVENKIELISSAVDFGTIQLLPDGQLIVLMADHQTTGGYPRIGNVITADLPLLAQCGVKEPIRLRFISLAEAEELLILREKEINKLKATIRLLSVI